MNDKHEQLQRGSLLAGTTVLDPKAQAEEGSAYSSIKLFEEETQKNTNGKKPLGESPTRSGGAFTNTLSTLDPYLSIGNYIHSGGKGKS